MKSFIVFVLLSLTTLAFCQRFNKKIETLYDINNLEEGLDLVNIEKGKVMFQSDKELLFAKMIHFLDWEGKLHVKKEDLKSARKSFEEGLHFLDLKLDLYPEKISNFDLNILESYADLNMETGSLWEALQLLNLSDSLRQQHDFTLENDNQNNFYFGKYYYIIKDYKKSSAYLKKDILHIKNLNYTRQDLYRVAKAYNFMAEIEIEEGRPWFSKKYAQKAYDHSSLDWIDHNIKNSFEEKIKAKNNISRSDVLLGDLISAKENSDDALRIFTSEKADTSFEYLNLWMNRAEILWQLNLYIDAHHSFELANKIQLQYVRKVIPRLSEQEKENFYFRLLDNNNIFYAFCVDYLKTITNDIDRVSLLKEILNLRINTKSKVLNETGKVSGFVQKTYDPEIRVINNQLKEKRDAYSLKANNSGVSELELDKLSSQIAMLEKKIIDVLDEDGILMTGKVNHLRNLPPFMHKNSVAIEVFRIPKYSKSKFITKADIKKYRKDTSSYVLTSRFNYEAPLYLYVKIDDKSSVDYSVVLEGEKLEGKYYNYYCNSNRFLAADKLSYKVYVAPFEKWIINKDMIYFSGDGVYNQINLNILKDVKSGIYFLEKHKLFNLGSLVDLENVSESNKDLSSALLFGRPKYSLHHNKTSDSSVEDISQNGINEYLDVTDLPATEVEVDFINEILQKDHLETDKFVGSNATEYELKHHSSASIIHIATHGFFIKGTKENAHLNPMLKSGLLFAGVSDFNGESTYDDGILTAYEVSNIDLKETVLVILSACETGLGEVKDGEGVYGLQRAFQIAGVNYVLMSMWKVDDEATMVLMNAFYSNLHLTKNIPESFQRAQIEVKNKYSHPYFWGAFKLVGI